MSGAARRAMRILEIETFGRGGLIHYAYSLSCALAERGHELRLLTAACYELEDRHLPSKLELDTAIGGFSHRMQQRLPGPISSVARKVEAVVDAFRVTAIARRLRPEVIHFHCTNPVSLVYLSLLRRLRTPLVATAHVVTPHERIPFQQAAYRRVHRLADLVIAHSGFDRRRLVEDFAVDPRRVVVIPHGDYGFFEDAGEPADREGARRGFGLEPEDEVALFFGYIREYKGLDLLLEAWPKVVAVRPGARLLVAGDPVRLKPERRRELEARATRLGAVHRFEYIPFSEVSRYFAAADVLVMPYRHVSQSGVLYLALSLGLPVVATTVGGLPELLRDGDNALLVPPEAPAELARAVIRMLAEPELRDRLARGGRRVAEQHSWPAIAERTASAFARLVGD